MSKASDTRREWRAKKRLAQPELHSQTREVAVPPRPRFGVTIWYDPAGDTADLSLVDPNGPQPAQQHVARACELVRNQCIANLAVAAYQAKVKAEEEKAKGVGSVTWSDKGIGAREDASYATLDPSQLTPNGDAGK